MTAPRHPLLPPILHLNSARTWRGGENQTLLLCRGLVQRGYRSLIGCPALSPLDSAARDEGIEVLNLPLRGEWDIFSAVALAGIIKSQGIGILHLQTAHAHAIGVIASPFVPRCRFVLARRVDFHVRNNPLSRLKFRLAVDRIICVSEGVKKVLVSDGIDPDRCEVVRDGIDLERFRDAEPDPRLAGQLGLHPADTVIGTIGALAPHKDIFNLIEAAALLKAEFPRLRVLVAGEGELYDPLVRFRDERGLADTVRFLGFRRDVPQLLRLLNVFVLSSYLEGLSSSVLDAMASGTPVVATRTGGVPEIVRDEVTGLLAPPSDPSALAGAIARVLRDRDLGLRLAAGAAEFVKHFSDDLMVENTIAVYGKTLGRDADKG